MEPIWAFIAGVRWGFAQPQETRRQTKVPSKAKKVSKKLIFFVFQNFLIRFC